MHFVDLDISATDHDIDVVENRVRLKFPRSLREIFLNYNGGRPRPNHFTDATIPIRTVVSELLPIISTDEELTAESSYRRLVLSRRLVSKYLFPFAIDGGGDYFFIDCTEGCENIYFYDSNQLPNRPLCDLKMNLTQFFESLHDPE